MTFLPTARISFVLSVLSLFQYIQLTLRPHTSFFFLQVFPISLRIGSFFPHSTARMSAHSALSSLITHTVGSPSKTRAECSVWLWHLIHTTHFAGISISLVLIVASIIFIDSVSSNSIKYPLFNHTSVGILETMLAAFPVNFIALYVQLLPNFSVKYSFSVVINDIPPSPDPHDWNCPPNQKSTLHKPY